MSVSTPDMAALLGLSGLGHGTGFASTLDRRFITGPITPATGVMQMSGIWLSAGLIVTNIVLITGATGVTTNTHNWAALYRNDLVLLAQSADDTGGTDYAANTKITKTLTAAQTCPYTGLYYLAWMQTASTPNTLLGAVAVAASIACADLPVVSGTSTTGLTTTAPNPAAAITGTVNSFYAYVT